MSEDFTGSDGEATLAGVTIGDAGVPPPAPAPDTSLGRYVVISTLGAGGMGTVYRAYDPKLQREVALKQLRRGETDQDRARVLREARSMARLNHPNVVAVFDVDETVEPPLVAMEYIPGVTLRRWLRKERPWRTVIDVFASVGHGLFAAHRAGLVHRDFKPSNVLISTQEDSSGQRRRRVLVADFGLARELDTNASHGPYMSLEAGAPVPPPVLESNDSTNISGVKGTPRYMAPEQHAGRDPDERADQYAFCLAMWEALTRTYPFPQDTSERIAAKNAGPPKWVGNRAVPGAVVAALRRGLSPEPSDRWPSLEPLLGVLERHRTDRARISKAWVGLGSAALIGTGVVLWMQVGDRCSGGEVQMDEIWNEARRARIAASFAAVKAGFATRVWSDTQTSVDAFATQWVAAHRNACESAEEAVTTPDDLDRQMTCLRRAKRGLDGALLLLEDIDTETATRAHEIVAGVPEPGTCEDVEALRTDERVPPARVASAVEEIRAGFDRVHGLETAGRSEEALQLALDLRVQAADLDYPPILAEALFTVGNAAHGARQSERSREALTQSIELSLELGMERIAVRAAMLLVRDYVDHFDPDLAVAQRIADFMWPILETRFPDTLLMASGFDALGFLRDKQGRYEEALEFAKRSLELQNSLLSEGDIDVSKALNNLGLRYQSLDRMVEALQIYERSLAIKEAKLGESHPLLISTLNNLGTVARAHEDLTRAEAYYQRALVIAEDVYGDASPEIAWIIDNLGIIHYDRGEYPQALERFERALELTEGAGEQETAESVRFRVHVAATERQLGNLPRAIALNLECLAYYRRVLGPRHPQTASLLNNLGNAYRVAGRLEDAEQTLRESLELRGLSHDPGHPDILQSKANLAAIFVERGKRDQARALLTTALEGYLALEPVPQSRVADMQLQLGELALGDDDWDDAFARAQDGLERVAALEVPAPLRAGLLALRGRAAYERGQRAEGRADVRAALAAFEDGPERARDRKADIERWLASH